MSARTGRKRQGGAARREEDPRVVRSRAAVVEAAKMVFLQKGYVGATMEEIAEVAGVTKRTVYNNYADKDALFRQIVADVITYAEAFARDLGGGLGQDLAAADLKDALEELGRRLALSIVQPDVIALRRLLIGESRQFPDLAREYYNRAPGRVIAALSVEFARLSRAGVLRGEAGGKRAAEQFAYLVAGAPLDRAMLTGTVPSKAAVLAGVRDGVDTFLARYGLTARGRK